MFREYGEERYARRIAREIVRRRERAPIETTTELVDAIKRAVRRRRSSRGGHPARRMFQAIRIAVNDELGSLERALPAAWELLRPGGRMAAISFHSLEDRQVKRFFADLARGCICPPELPVCVCGHEPEAELSTRRADAAHAGEVADNPRAQSGRLRAAIKLDRRGGGARPAGPACRTPGRPPRGEAVVTPPTAAPARRKTAQAVRHRPARLGPGAPRRPRAPSPHRARWRRPSLRARSPTAPRRSLRTLRDSRLRRPPGPRPRLDRPAGRAADRPGRR